MGKAVSDRVAEVLAALDARVESLPVEGNGVRLSSLEKVLWPAYGDMPPVTKRDLIGYYAQVSDYLLPHLRDRPLSWVRYASGIEGKREFHKHYKPGLPEYVERTYIWSNKSQRATEYVLPNTLSTLVWLGQTNTIEVHPWYSRVCADDDAEGVPTDFASSEEALIQSVLNYPDYIVFDLDPYIYSGSEAEGGEPELNRKAWEATVDVAHELREVLTSVGLKAWLKSSGKSGLHVYIPIVRNMPFELTRPFAESIGHELLRRCPKKVTMDWTVENRAGKIFFDHNQNVRGKTLVAPYSPRAVPGARITWLLKWDELESYYPEDFTIHNAPELLAERGDIWSGILDHKQDLQKIIG